MKLRVGLLGAGGFGYLHLSGYKKNEKCELVAVATRTEQHAKQTAEKFNVPKYYFGDDWIKMLQEVRLDVVSICSPNYLHAPMTIEAIKNDVNVLCEKPICISQNELHEIETLLNTKDLIYFSSFQKRYIELFKHIKYIVDNEVLGNLNLVRYFFSHRGPYTSWKPLSEQKWFFDTEKAGGGVLLDLGVHCIDILRYLIGEFRAVEGYSHNTSCKNIKDEDNCNVLVRFENDALAMITSSWCNEPKELLEIFGTKGNIKVDLNAKEPITFAPKKLKRNQFVQAAIEHKTTSLITQHLLIDHFIDCVVKGKQERPDFNDGKRAVEFVLQAYSLK